MKILQVITSLRQGGAERLVTDLSKGLKDKGHEVEVFVMDSSRTPLTKELEDSDIKLHGGPKGFIQMWNPFNFFKLRSIIKKRKYDIIHTHNSSVQYLTCIAGKDSTLVTTEHSTNNRRRSLSIFKKIDQAMYSRYKKVIAVSKSTQQNLINYLEDKKMPSRIELIYNGINLSNFEAKKQEISNTKGEIIVIMVAGFRPPKDQSTLIRAMATLPDNYKLWLVGDGSTRKENEQLAADLGISSRVKFLGFRVDIKELLKKSDIFVLSSHYEGCAISIIEAMSTGLPVIGSNVDGISEIVTDNGIIFKEGDYEELALKIKTLSEDKKLYRSVSHKGKIFSKEFDINSTLTKHIILYQNLITLNKE